MIYHVPVICDSYPERINKLKTSLRRTPYLTLLRGECGAGITAEFCQLVRDYASGRTESIAVAIDFNLNRHLPKLSEAVDSFCVRYFTEQEVAGWIRYFVVETLLSVVEDPSLGVVIGIEVARSRMPNARVDKDGLCFVEPSSDILTKEGLLRDSSWFLFDKRLPGTNLTGGFADELSKHTVALPGNQIRVRLNPSIVADRRLHVDTMTKAYIRGPREISESILNDNSFPERTDGTVTVHARTESDPVRDLYPIDRIEVMWSRRKDLKTVQIEELKPIANSVVSLRYLHSIWDTSQNAFVHLDGAIKRYGKLEYESRFATDIRKADTNPLEYSKLFRVDGGVPLEAWAVLATKFFDPNELVLEYIETAFDLAS